MFKISYFYEIIIRTSVINSTLSEVIMLFSKKIVAAAFLSFPLVAGAASLANLQSVSTDVTFFAPNMFSHTLNSVKGLTAGNISQATIIANGTVNTTGAGQKAQYALLFPSTGNIPDAGSENVTVQGKNDSTNTIRVTLQKDPSMTGSLVNEQINGASWKVYDAEVDVLKYDVAMLPGPVNADVYPVSVVAAVYTN